MSILENIITITTLIIFVKQGYYWIKEEKNINLIDRIVNSKPVVYCYRAILIAGFCAILLFAFLAGTLEIIDNQLFYGIIVFFTISVSGVAWIYFSWIPNKK